MDMQRDIPAFRMMAEAKHKDGLQYGISYIWKLPVCMIIVVILFH